MCDSLGWVWLDRGWPGLGLVMDGVQKVRIDEETDKVEADIEGWRQFVLRWKWF